MNDNKAFNLLTHLADLKTHLARIRENPLASSSDMVDFIVGRIEYYLAFDDARSIHAAWALYEMSSVLRHFSEIILFKPPEVKLIPTIGFSTIQDPLSFDVTPPLLPPDAISAEPPRTKRVYRRRSALPPIPSTAAGLIQSTTEAELKPNHGDLNGLEWRTIQKVADHVKPEVLPKPKPVVVLPKPKTKRKKVANRSSTAAPVPISRKINGNGWIHPRVQQVLKQVPPRGKPAFVPTKTAMELSLDAAAEKRRRLNGKT